jgi:hypothetical protein
MRDGEGGLIMIFQCLPVEIGFFGYHRLAVASIFKFGSGYGGIDAPANF